MPLLTPLINKAKSAGYLARLFFRAFSPYRLQIAFMAVLSFVSGALEGIGITAVIPLFSFLLGNGATDTVSRAIAGFFTFFGLPFTAKFVFIFMLALFVGKAGLLLLAQQITARVNADFEKKTREQLLTRTLRANWPFLSSQKLGALDQMLTTDVVNSSSILLYISNSVFIVVNLLVYSYLVFNTSPVIALLTVLSGGVIFFIFLPLLQRAKALSGAMEGEIKRLAHYANEHILGAKTVKSLAVEDAALSRGSAFGEKMRKLYIRFSFLQNLTGALLSLVGVLFVMGLFAYLYKTSSFEFGAFVVVVFALNRVFSNVQYAQSSAHAISMQIPYLESLLRYLGEAKRHEEVAGGTKPFSFTRELAFSEVDFSYRAGEIALAGVDLSIKKGAIVGLVGPSGAGKTTMVDLLLRLIAPSSGAVLLDGVDACTVDLKEWRANIGYVSQDIFLLNDTIRSNIRFYGEMSDADIIEAARAANILGFIESLPERFDTMVGERGVLLSGGQRQRIVLARALARKQQILLLDEATSALDNESEALIQKSIEHLRGKTTIIIIAHRLSTVLISDSLVVIEKGRVIEEGSPKELLKDKESYFSKTYHLRK